MTRFMQAGLTLIPPLPLPPHVNAFSSFLQVWNAQSAVFDVELGATNNGRNASKTDGHVSLERGPQWMDKGQLFTAKLTIHC